VHAWKHGRRTRGRGGGGGGHTWLQLRSPAAPFSSNVVIGRGVARAVLAAEVGLTKPADPVLPEVCYRSWQIGGRLLLWDSLVSMSAILSWLFFLRILSSFTRRACILISVYPNERYMHQIHSCNCVTLGGEVSRISVPSTYKWRQLIPAVFKNQGEDL
jgi:hypothetical protein